MNRIILLFVALLIAGNHAPYATEQNDAQESYLRSITIQLKDKDHRVQLAKKVLPFVACYVHNNETKNYKKINFILPQTFI